MTPWSQSEALRTIDEAKRRSLVDPEFRALVLTDPLTALAKINPRQIPPGSVLFVESRGATPHVVDPKVMVVILPDLGTVTDDDAEELSEDDLQQVAGGVTGPPPPDPPIGNS